MGTTINVDGLIFTFSTEWAAFAYDQTSDHLNNPNQAIIANDLVAARSGSGICFIEVKDYGTNPGQDRGKLMDGSLETKVAHKVRDTIAGIVGFARTSPNPADFLRVAREFCSSGPGLKLVLWVETDLNFLNHQRQKQRASTFNKRLKQRLAWATRDVLVCNRNIVGSVLPGITVRDATS